MKLSDAIRKGCEMRPKQAFHSLYGTGDESCVIGAARDGLGMGSDDSICKHFERIMKQSNRCPSCAGWSPMYSLITDHLNDRHRWSREAIADWIEKNYEVSA